MAYILQSIPLQVIITDPHQPRNIPATLEELEGLANQADVHAKRY